MPEDLELADSATLINSALDTPPISSFDLPDEEIVLPMTSGKQGDAGLDRGEISLAEQIHDQADGLRRLLVQDLPPRHNGHIGQRGRRQNDNGDQLAAALAHAGKKVLIIDENVGAGNVCATLGLNAHRDLLDVIRRDKKLDKVIVASRDGIRVLPAGARHDGS